VVLVHIELVIGIRSSQQVQQPQQPSPWQQQRSNIGISSSSNSAFAASSSAAITSAGPPSSSSSSSSTQKQTKPSSKYGATNSATVKPNLAPLLEGKLTV
jgi:hypothetical protein